MDLAWHSLQNAPSDRTTLVFYKAALASGKLGAAVEIKSTHEDLIEKANNWIDGAAINRLADELKALPPEKRIRLGALAQAQKLYKDDVLPAALPYKGYYDEDNKYVTDIAQKSELNWMAYSNYRHSLVAMPEVSGAVLQFRFKLRETDPGPVWEERHMSISFKYPGLSPTKGLKAFLRVVVDENSVRIVEMDGFEVRLYCGRLYDEEHMLTMAACGGMAEVLLDGQSVFNCPLPALRQNFMVGIHNQGLRMNLREMHFFEPLTETDYRARIKADPNAKFPGGRTRLHIAAGANLVQESTVLLELGVDINAGDDGGMTPLMWAARSGSAAAVDTLLAKHANTTPQDKKKKNAADHAREKGFVPLAETIQKSAPAVKPPSPPKDEF
jgi:hypothetical protein